MQAQWSTENRYIKTNAKSSFLASVSDVLKVYGSTIDLDDNMLQILIYEDRYLAI